MRLLPPTPEAIAVAAEAIRAGRLVAMPTETVYGLAADATNAIAVARIYETKGRPRFNPLIVHLSTLEEARRLVEVSPPADLLASAFWPGPLTLVLRAKRANGIADLVTAGLDTLAIRLPAHPVARALLEASGRPLAAPSANRSGRVSPTTAAHVAAEFEGSDVTILDGGPAEHGLESTILDASSDGLVLLRPGSISIERIEGLTGLRIERLAIDPSRPTAPGQLVSHYAPHAGVRLNATSVRAGEALLAFGPVPLQTDGPVINLSERGDLTEAATRLFASLRELDASGAAAIAVMPIPFGGLGEAINDRLARAAAPRA